MPLLTTALLLVGILAACGDRNPPEGNSPEGITVPPVESSAAQEKAFVGESGSSDAAVIKEKPAAEPLDLSLPADYQDDGVRDLSEEEQSRFQTDDYFKKSDDEKRVKVHSKVYVKDGTTLDSARQDYRESLEGGEVGVEYQLK